MWSDVVCPWCYLGKRRLDAALSRFDHTGEVEVRWHSFELDPTAPRVRDVPPAEWLARRYGMTAEQATAANDQLSGLAAEEGLEYHLDRLRMGNSFDAHRLLHLAGDRGVQDRLEERLFAAYFTDGEAIGDPEVLRRLAVAAGLDEEEVSRVLDGDAYSEDVRADEAMARELQVSGVPFFVVDRRYAIPGAQESDTILSVLRRAWEEREPAA